MPHIRVYTLHCHSPSITSWARIVRLPYVWTMAVETKVIRVGTQKGTAGKQGGSTGVSPHWGWGVNGVGGERLFSVSEGLSPQLPAFRPEGMGPLLHGSLGVLPCPLFDPGQQTPLLGWASLLVICCFQCVGESTIKSIFLANSSRQGRLAMLYAFFGHFLFGLADV